MMLLTLSELEALAPHRYDLQLTQWPWQHACIKCVMELYHKSLIFEMGWGFVRR